MKALGKLATLAALAAVVIYAQHRDPATGDPGANDDPTPERSAYVAPADGTVTSGFGPRWGSMHYGLDIAAPHGTPIRAVTRARVIEAGPASGFGNWVRLLHPDGTVTVYGHMARYHVHTGQRVRAGQHIADVGSEGQSTGPHLHFEVWPDGQRAQRIDPAPWLTRHGVHL